MQMQPTGSGCDDAREWVNAYLDALVKSSVKADTASSAAHARGAAIEKSQARRYKMPRMAHRWVTR